MGRVEAICVSEKTGVQKTPVPRARLRAGFGIEGDAHAGDWHRQVSLLSASDIAEARLRLPDIADGAFAENLVLSGVDFSRLTVGARLRLGTSVVLRITQIGKECHTPCRIGQLTGDCIMPRLGRFASVEEGGEIAAGDPVELLG
ncbi:MAG: MOSC domain-containing protein [Myxococcales bacterium]|nr:MOSC domain-containing protein [Myxococcales bacterium]